MTKFRSLSGTFEIENEELKNGQYVFLEESEYSWWDCPAVSLDKKYVNKYR